MPIPAGYTSGQIIQAVVGVGKILQVVSVFKADTFSMTGSTYTDVTGLSVSITPQSSTSQILCMGQINAGLVTGEILFGQLVRGATVIGNGTGGSTINSITTTGAVALITFPVASNSTNTITFDLDDLVIAAGETIIVAIKTTGAVTGELSLNWYEQQ